MYPELQLAASHNPVTVLFELFHDGVFHDATPVLLLHAMSHEVYVEMLVSVLFPSAHAVHADEPLLEE